MSGLFFHPAKQKPQKPQKMKNSLRVWGLGFGVLCKKREKPKPKPQCYNLKK